MLLIEGSPGLGKTTLLDAAAAIAAEIKMQTRRVTLYDTANAVPLSDVLTALVAYSSPNLGTTHAVPFTTQPTVSDPVFRASESALVAIEELVVNGPLLLCIDDAHWCDDAMALMLQSLLRRIHELPLCVLLTANLDGAHQSFLRVRTKVLMSHSSQLIVEPLSVAPTDVQPLNRNDAALHALRCGDDAALEILQAAAILGRRFNAGDVVLLTQLPATDIANAIEAATALRMVFEHPSSGACSHAFSHEFSHELMHRAVYESLNPAIRVALHDEAAAMLRSQQRDETVIASHLSISAVATDSEARRTLTSVAARLVGHSPDYANTFLDAALAIWDVDNDVPQNWVMASTLAHCGRLTEAAAIAAHIAQDERAASPIQAQALALVAQISVMQGNDSAAAASALRDAAALSSADSLLHATLLGDLSVALLEIGAFDEASAVVGQCLELANSLDTPWPLCDALCTRSWIEAFAYDFDSAVATATEAVAVLATGGHAARARSAPEFFAGMVLLDADRLDEADAMFAAGAEAGQHPGASWMLPLNDFGAAASRYARGEWDEAVAITETALQLAGDLGTVLGVPFGHAILSLIVIARDDVVTARTHIELANQSLRIGVPAVGFDWVLLAETYALEAEGHADRALELIAGLWDLDVALNMWNDLPELAPQLLRLASTGADTARLESATSSIDDLARRHPTAFTMSASAHAHMWRDGTSDSARAAIELARFRPRLVDVAGVFADASLVLARNGEREEALIWLDAALKAYERVGARRWSARLLRSARSVGMRTRRAASQRRHDIGWQALSLTERDVANLVHTGLSNHDIGERLFISRRTVETHVRHILQKLGVQTRVAIALAAANNEPAPR